MIKRILFEGPVQSTSGYGSRTRDLALSLKDNENYEVYIYPMSWGRTPDTGLDQLSEDDRTWILQRIDSIKDVKDKTIDVFVKVGLPSEFRRVGKFNIGVTAGIETDQCNPAWIHNINESVDLCLVSSNWSKHVLSKTKVYQNNKLAGEIEATTPIEVLFEGINTNVFNGTYTKTSFSETLDNIPERFVFLNVGHWLPGEVTHDRKDISGTIISFLDTFKVPVGKKKHMPALVLKCGVNNSVKEVEAFQAKIQPLKEFFVKEFTLPNVYLLNGSFSNEEMNELYMHPKVKCMYSLTKGEGYGRPFLEFSTTGKPIIAPYHTGFTDFMLLNDGLFEVKSELVKIHESAVVKDILLPYSQWMDSDYASGVQLLKKMYKEYNNYSTHKQKYHSLTNFNKKKMSELFDFYIDTYVPKHETITLPKEFTPTPKEVPTLV